MTAFEEVLAAEQEAERTIDTAKEEVANATAAAKAEQQVRSKAVKERLEAAEQTALVEQDRKLEQAITQISTEAAARVKSFKERFGSRKTDLKNIITRAFE